MSKLPLVPTITSGRPITIETTINNRELYKKQHIRIVDIGFQNQGSNSIAIIKYDSGETRLASGTNGAGAWFSPKIDAGYCDVSQYTITFEPINPALAYEHKLNYSFRQIVDTV